MSSLSVEEGSRIPVYVVIGATGGIGSEVCRRLSDKKARVVAVSRDQEKLSALSAAREVEPLVVDATIAAQVKQCIKQIVERYGHIDGVVNCVGSLLLKPAHLTTDEEWNATIANNLNSAFYVLGSAVRVMMKTGGGSIVLISSAAARVGLANHEAIGAAKAGIIGLGLSAAATYASQKIRVNIIAPGLIRTPLTARLTANDVVLKASTAMHALGRIGEPSDVASAIEWLLDPHQSWVTGQVLGIDGGLSAVRPR
jgi:NAD(P)-dependent dehydrogenase (short-subunit alcohol dehydrogenase family)